MGRLNVFSFVLAEVVADVRDVEDPDCGCGNAMMGGSVGLDSLLFSLVFGGIVPIVSGVGESFKQYKGRGSRRLKLHNSRKNRNKSLRRSKVGPNVEGIMPVGPEGNKVFPVEEKGEVSRREALAKAERWGGRISVRDSQTARCI